jgi:pimeloyl-ACP methyl ester carboxylesterase
MKDKIVFIHGAWMTPLCWENYVAYFESKGYRCLAPPWPHRDKSIDELRAHPPKELAGLGVQEIVDHYDKFIRGLDEKPILIGHSFGGLFVQLLLDRGLGKAGVAIHPAPPRGVIPQQWSAIRANAGVLFRWGAWKNIVHLSFKQFQYAFVNTMNLEAQNEAYERFVVPETGRIFFQAALALMDAQSPVRVDFENRKRSPLLLIAGSADHIVPARVNRLNMNKFLHSGARTDFKEFPGRSHWTIAEDGWDEVASYIEQWLGALET